MRASRTCPRPGVLVPHLPCVRLLAKCCYLRVSWRQWLGNTSLPESAAFRARSRLSARSRAYSWASRLSRSAVRARAHLLAFWGGIVLDVECLLLRIFSRHGCFGTGPRAPYPARTLWRLRILRASRGRTAGARRACYVTSRGPYFLYFKTFFWICQNHNKYTSVLDMSKNMVSSNK